MASSLFGSPARAVRPATASSAPMNIDPRVIQSVKQMMGMLKTAQNPGAAIQMMAQQNPQVAAVIQMCQGRNPKDVFYDQCRQHGVNPDDIIKQIM